MTINGGTYLLPCDRAATYHAIHSVRKLQALAEFVRPGDLVFDIGAHVGLFSVLASRGGARCILVEPNVNLLMLIEENMKGRDFEVVAAAVHTATGRGVLHVSEGSTQVSSLDPSAAALEGSTTPMEVPVTSLPALIAEHGSPDVIKIDVQGAESAVLLQSMAALSGVRTVLVEASMLDPNLPSLLLSLEKAFGRPEVVNDVYLGADLAYERPNRT